MAANCVECGTPLDEVPFVDCAAHRSWDDMQATELRASTDQFVNVSDQQIHNEIAIRNAEPLVTLEMVYTGYGDYDVIEVDFAVPGDEQRLIPFPPPETHL
jgi:hypothetical protein